VNKECESESESFSFLKIDIVNLASGVALCGSHDVNIQALANWLIITFHIALSSVQFSSVKGGIYELGKVHMRIIHSTPSVGCFPNVVFETVPSCSSDGRWPTLVPSANIVERFRFPRLFPPGDLWFDVLAMA